MATALELYLQQHPEKEEAFALSLATQFRMIIIDCLSEMPYSAQPEAEIKLRNREAALQFMLEYLRNDIFATLNLAYALNMALKDDLNARFERQMLEEELHWRNHQASPALRTLVSAAINLLYERAGITSEFRVQSVV